jgi:hypothetical protein
MVMNTVIFWDLQDEDEPVLESLRGKIPSERVEWSSLRGRRLHHAGDTEGTTFEASEEAVLATGLNLAIRKAAGRNVLVLGRPGRKFEAHLASLEEFLANDGSRIGVGMGISSDALALHVDRCGEYSALPFLFASSGRFCSRRSNFSAREPFDPSLSRSEMWLDFAYGHLLRCAKASGGRNRNFWGNAAFHPGLDSMDGSVREEAPPPETWARFVERHRQLELDLANPLVHAHLSVADEDPRARADRLSRIEAILRCARDLIPTRETFSFLQEARA